MEQTSISIIIPAYNVENYIENTLTSVLSQINESVEIIVVNDGSTDNTQHIIRRFSNADNRQNYHVFDKQNGGVSSARNLGIKKAKGEYIIFLDGDDMLAPGTIAKLLEVLQKRKPDVAHWAYNQTTKEKETLQEFPFVKHNEEERAGNKVLEAMFFEYSTWIWTGSAAYRRELIINKGINYTQDCVAGEDLEFTFKMLAVSDKVIFIQDALSLYVQRPTSVMSQYNIKKFDVVRAYERVSRFFIQQNDDVLQKLAMRINDTMLADNFIRTFFACYEQLMNQKKMNGYIAMRHINQGLSMHYPGMKKSICVSILKSRSKAWKLFCFSPWIYYKICMLRKAKRRR